MRSDLHLKERGPGAARAASLRSEVENAPYPHWLVLQLTISGALWAAIVLGVLRLG